MKALAPASTITATDVYADLQKCSDVTACAAVFKRAVAAYAVDVFACGADLRRPGALDLGDDDRRVRRPRVLGAIAPQSRRCRLTR